MTIVKYFKSIILYQKMLLEHVQFIPVKKIASAFLCCVQHYQISLMLNWEANYTLNDLDKLVQIIQSLISWHLVSHSHKQPFVYGSSCFTADINSPFINIMQRKRLLQCCQQVHNQVKKIILCIMGDIHLGDSKTTGNSLKDLNINTTYNKPI